MPSDKCIHDLLKKAAKTNQMFLVEKLATREVPAEKCQCGKNDEKNNNLTYAFYIACRYNNLENAKNMLSLNKKIIAIYGNSNKSRKTKVNKFDININAQFGYYNINCINEAMDHENIDLIDLLLQNGANVNSKTSTKDTILFKALEKKNIDIVKLLLGYGATVNILGQDGDSPLSYAIENCDCQMVDTLLQNGANVNFKNSNNDIPLILAANNPEANLEIVEILVQYGANLDAQDSDGDTALHLAVKGRSLELVKYLIEKIPNYLIKNKQGLTVIDIAAATSYFGYFTNIDILLVLLKHYNITCSDLVKIIGCNKFKKIKQNKKIKKFFSKGKIKHKNRILIFAHNFDDRSLLNCDYLYEDLFLKILHEANMQYYSEKYNIV